MFVLTMMLAGMVLMSWKTSLAIRRHENQKVEEEDASAAMKALLKAWKVGTAGLIAGVFQVICFMWLRTVMNHQYANGDTMSNAATILYREGGVKRFYKGIEWAIIQAPLTRFGDTFMNTGALAYRELYAPNIPLSWATFFGSVLSATFRVTITPIDTLKTTRQVHGDASYALLVAKVKQKGVLELFNGWEANFVASWVGTYPWFLVFNFLSSAWPAWSGPYKHLRNGIIGICASAASDTSSNSLRVLKTIRQTHPDTSTGYIEAARIVVQKDGLRGLFGRGLVTRLLVNVLQGVFFTIIWRALSE
eukprot:TRINITY_DN20031_c0_g1_i1.p1 TRINITY_DN20031_c0_g1~~TRINITY_DN20031_c0_g1_i1.p1  ORF type:complete len:328 (+),score=48.66 TRINITY_DN20031_c0_g1_i1:68-985(+)